MDWFPRNNPNVSQLSQKQGPADYISNCLSVASLNYVGMLIRGLPIWGALALEQNRARELWPFLSTIGGLIDIQNALVAIEVTYGITS